jgi:sugar-specific transcriptional regulator TrmB
MMRNRDYLLELGLNKQEIEVYDLIIRRGALRASEISLLIKATRPNTYNILKSLISKHLIQEDRHLKVKRFLACPPQNFRPIMERKEAAMSELKLKFESDIAQLISEYTVGQGLPGVSNYQGETGIRKVYSDLLADGKEICSIQDMHFIDSFLSDYNNEFIKERVKRRIIHRLICPRSSVEFPPAPYRSMRFFPSKNFKWFLDLKINHKKIAIISTSSVLLNAVVIQSPEISLSFKSLFEVLWSLAEE